MLNWLNNRCVYLIKVGLLVMPIGLFSGLSQASMLSEAITEVLKSHPKILQKQYESDLLDAKISGLRADYLPTVDLLVAAGTEQIRKSDAPSNGLLPRGDISVVVAQNIYDGHSTDYKIERLNRKRMEVHYHLQAISSDVALRLAELYIDRLRHKAAIDYQTNLVGAHKDLRQKIAFRVDQGISNEVDLTDVDLRLIEAEVSLAAAQANYADSKSQYLAFIGASTDNLEEPEFSYGLELEGYFSLIDPFSGNVEPYRAVPLDLTISELIDISQANHPVLNANKYNVEAHRLNLDIESALEVPVINFELVAGWGHNSAGDIGNKQHLSAMLNLKYNIFNGDKRTYKKLELSSSLETAKQQYIDKSREVEDSLRLSWQALNLHKKLEKIMEQRILTAQSYKDKAKLQLKLGKIELQDMLDVETKLVNAQIDLLSAKHDYIYSYYRVLHSLGYILSHFGLQV